MNDDSATADLLLEIGSQLDRGQYPSVDINGIVKPGAPITVSLIPGEEINNEFQRQTRSETRQGYGPSRWQGASNRTRSTNTSASLFRTSLREACEEQINDVIAAYPETKVWQQAEGMWLLTESSVLPNLGKKATFLTAIPYTNTGRQRSWGFWTTPISWSWIGPRHTNFPDGSICAFESKDGTWNMGESIVTLLDLYTLWALRHEYLRVFGRWPGYQSVQHSYERLVELNDDEYCGCDSSNKLYVDCCKQTDLDIPTNRSLADFMRYTCCNLRREPPKQIREFMLNPGEPPPIQSLLRY